MPYTIDECVNTQDKSDGLNLLLQLIQGLDSSDPAWISIASEQQIKDQWQSLQDPQHKCAYLPLFGVPFAVKDNIDAAGFPTTAACPDFAYYPDEDARSVQLLKASGAILVGKTNLDAFATGLVGTRSPYGAVPNTFNPEFISGGSSSGSASVVARGLVPFALGTDTAGSGRVPAVFNNIVGLKGTRGAVSTLGVLPACRSLDCVTVLALNLQDAATVYDIISQYDEEDAYSRERPATSESKILNEPRIAICDNPEWFGDINQQEAYKAALDKASPLPWSLEPVDFCDLFKLASLLYEGPWVAERYAAIKEIIERPEVKMDSTVRTIIERGKEFSAVDAFQYEYLKNDLIRTIEKQFEAYDVILVPTTPTFPTLEQVAKNPVEENSKLGTYTNFVNFMDWTAISIPAGFRTDGLPFGITLISKRWQEPQLLHLGWQWLNSFGERRLGALPCNAIEVKPVTKIEAQSADPLVQLAVVGAHISGLPLNHQLTDLSATLKCWTKTSPKYRLFELPQVGKIRKPGLRRVTGGEAGAKIELQVWNLTSTAMGKFLKLVPPPLAIGSVELEDRSWVKGFVCEPIGFEGALDVTEFGGWKAYMASLNT